MSVRVYIGNRRDFNKRLDCKVQIEEAARTLHGSVELKVESLPSLSSLSRGQGCLCRSLKLSHPRKTTHGLR